MTREPFIAHSELTNEIYVVVGKEKYRVTEQAIKAVMAIKALKQEPKTGHWKEVGEEYIQVYDLNGIPSCGDERICSECGFETVFIGEHCSQYKFCPNCGAEMKEGDA